MLAISAPFTTAVPTAKVFAATSRPAIGAMTAASPPVRGRVSAATRRLSRKTLLRCHLSAEIEGPLLLFREGDGFLLRFRRLLGGGSIGSNLNGPDVKCFGQ